MKVKAPLGLELYFSKYTCRHGKQVINIGGWAGAKSMSFGDITVERGKPTVKIFNGAGGPNEVAVVLAEAQKFLATSKMARRAGVRPPYREVKVTRLDRCPYQRKDIERAEEMAHSKAAAREWEEMANWR
jgi:hypothetical protein